MPYAHITGWGMSAPERVLTNDDLAKVVETNDAWIRERTGIRERRIAREDQFPSTLAVDASIKALRVANLRPTDLDLIICSTSSPEYIFPATACLIQDQLGATKASDQPGGVLSAVMHSDGSGGDLLTLAGGGARYPANEATLVNGQHYIQMDGKEVFRFATRVMASATQEVLACAGLTLDQIQWIIPHQANIRII